MVTQNSSSQTKTSTRIFVGFMAFLMLASTIGLYASIVMRSQNPASNDSSDAQARLDANIQRQQEAVAEQALELSAQWFDKFVQHKSEVRAFNAASVTALATRDITVGDGAEITADFTDYSMYYIGWLPDETIFDSSFDDAANPTSLKAPLPGSGSYIEGWNEGVIGMRVGGVREITIPSEKGYGAEGQGESIPPNSPLKFIVMAIPAVETPPFPAGTFALCKEAYAGMYEGDTAELCAMMGYDNEEQ
jgi:FKBP-type peptidyl-prolyl cis-trans isomerase